MTPVILLSDGYLANGSELWKIPSMKDLPEIHPPLVEDNDCEYKPYKRDAETLVRSWAIPGQEGLRHHIGGLEKADLTGEISYDPINHEKMTIYRTEKVARVANDIPRQAVFGPAKGDLLVVGWGGTYGALYTAVTEMQEEGKNISLAQFNYINPLPVNTDEIFSQFKKILVCELNLGQFSGYLRSKLPQFNYLQFNKLQGLPFMISELKQKFNEVIEPERKLSIMENICIPTIQDFKMSQAARWCPGCGGHAVLAAVQRALPETGVTKEKVVFVSGIGCSSRFPYYIHTYGFHGLHGRGAAIATGIKLANPELSVWLVTGDGDSHGHWRKPFYSPAQKKPGYQYTAFQQ